MSPFKTAVLVGLATVLLTSAWQYRRHELRAQEVARLRSENDRLHLQASQRREARAAQALAASPTVLARGSTSSPIAGAVGGDSAAAETHAPETNYRNEGRATPVAAMQTLAWACDRGDASLMEKLIVFDGVAREKAERHFAALPGGIPPQWASLDGMAAALYVSDGMEHPYPVADILRLAKVDEIRPGRVVFRIPGAANGDGYEFQQTSDGWKLAITEQVVEDYIRRSEERAKRGP